MPPSPISAAPPGGLRARGIVAGYGGASVLQHVDVDIVPGQITALLGANGAGKTTTLKVLAGFLKPAAGQVLLDDVVCTSSAHRRARQGVAYVGESRHVFGPLTVRQSLHLVNDRDGWVLSHFPELGSLLGRRTSLLSGGQQQMLAIGMALARRPRLLMVDELSLGLAPSIRHRLLSMLRTTADEDGCGILVVEQSAPDVLKIADTAIALQRGRVVGTAPASEWLSQVDALGEFYVR